MQANKTLDLSADVIDVRDIIERIEELEAAQPLKSDDDLAELDGLKSIMDDLKGNGGDEQWDGDWYPVTLIRDSYFQDYAQELAEECGYLQAPDGYSTPLLNYIDWEAWARDVRMDYSGVDIDGVTYWYR